MSDVAHLLMEQDSRVLNLARKATTEVLQSEFLTRRSIDSAPKSFRTPTRGTRYSRRCRTAGHVGCCVPDRPGWPPQHDRTWGCCRRGRRNKQRSETDCGRISPISLRSRGVPRAPENERTDNRSAILSLIREQTSTGADRVVGERNGIQVTSALDRPAMIGQHP